MENIYKEEALERKRSGKKPEGVQNSAQGRTRDKLAEIANVSHGTIDKVKKIEANADEKTKKKLASGDITIHKAYMHKPVKLTTSCRC